MRYFSIFHGELTDYQDDQIQIFGEIWGGSSYVTRLVKELKANNLVGARSEISRLMKTNGLDFLTEIDGSFLMFYFNYQLKKGFLYRSLLCKNSLYYKESNDSFIWSNRVEDLWGPKSSLLDQVDKDVLLLTCLGESTMPNKSIYSSIKRLSAGHLYEFELNRNQKWIRRLDSFQYSQNVGLSIREFASETRRILLETINKRLNSNDQVAVILSGGLDSSVLLSALKESGANVKAYHWSFQGIPAADESDYAVMTANYLGVPLTQVFSEDIISKKNYLSKDWEFRLPYNHSFYYHYEWVRNDCLESGRNVLVTGYLGDSLFGPQFNNKISMRSIFRSYSIVEALRYIFESLGTPILGNTTDIHPRIAWFERFLSTDALEILARSYAAVTELESNSYQYVSNTFNHEIHSMLYQHLLEPYQYHFLYPFASKELIELCLSIPDCLRIIASGGQLYEKPILRLAFTDSLPKAVLSRNHRQVLTCMNERYVVQNQKQIDSILDEDSWLVKYGLVDRKNLQLLFKDTEGLARSASGLIPTCMTELWLKSLAAEERRMQFVPSL